MKKRFTKVLVLLLCVGCIFSGCGKKEEKKVVTEKESKAVKTEIIQAVGNQNADACHVLMTNLTEKNITGLTVKRSDEAEYPANMMKTDQKIEDKEKFNFYYILKEEEKNPEKDSEEQESELADALVNLTYSLQVSFEDKTVVELSSFAIEDMEEASLCYEDDVYFFKYKSISEKTEVTTKEMELMAKADNEKAEAVVKQIEGIGEVTLEIEANIQSIRAAYDALTDVQKTKITNLNKLTDAEKRLAELKQDASEKKTEEAATNNTTGNQSSDTNNSNVSSAPAQPTVPQQPATPEVPEQSTDGCLDNAEVNQPAAPEVPEQSTDGCLGDVEINQPAAPEQSADGCLGDVEINQ